MKIEIDLDDVFRGDDESPDETLQDSIRRQVISRLTEDYRKRLFQRFDTELTTIMQSQIAEVMQTKMPDMIDDIMNAKYTPVNSYGSRGEPTTFRDEIIKSVATNMRYEPKEYRHSENAFTQAVKSIVEKQTAAMTETLKDQIDGEFKKNALAYAVKAMSEKLGLVKA